MPTLVAVAALGAYAAALFAVGWWAQKRGVAKSRAGVLVCALGLGVYCTSWTFYGAVGTAARSGWDYLPIYLGPILAFTVGLPLIRRVVALGKAHGATSIADLLSRRFGRSGRLAGLVTGAAVLFSLPYLALQLIAVSTTFAAVSGLDAGRSPTLVIGVALGLGAFGLLFGTRERDITRPSPGLTGAIAFDSMFKLIAFLAVGALAIGSLLGAPGEAMPAAGPEGAGADRFILLTLLSAAAVLCLPRQFHMAVLAPSSEGQLRRAAPLFALYLLPFAILPPVIAAAGRALAPGTSPDLTVLALPEALDASALTLLAFTGGFAAAAGMVIVTGVALGSMVATDLVLPLVRKGRGDEAFRSALGIRRLSLAGLIAFAALLALAVPDDAPLADLGVTAFAGAAQYAPLLLAALFARRTSEAGAVAGLAVGSGAWLVFVLAPAAAPESAFDLSTAAVAVLPLSDAFTSGALLSLGLNASALVGVSLLTARSVAEREEAARFAAAAPPPVKGQVSVGDLADLLASVAGEADFGSGSGLSRGDAAPPALVEAAEARLSRVLGNASAHVLIRQLAGGDVRQDEMLLIAGEASRGLRASRMLLAETLENLAEGVSMIDAEGRLVAWNRAYEDLLDYPKDFLREGLPVEDLFRHNLPDADEANIRRRTAILREGRSHTNESRLAGGRVVRIQGRSVPNGGYVTSFSDVTEYREAQAALEESERSVRFYAENIPFPIAFCDAGGAIRFHNRSYAEMVGRAGDDLTGEALRDLLGEGYALREAAIGDALAGSEARFELGPDTIGGGTTWQVTYVPQRSDDGSVTGFFGFYQDISRRRAAQAALEDANRTLEARVTARTEEAEQARADAEAANSSKTRFLAAASHDVLQPLNAARLFASSLEDELVPDTAQRATAQRIGAAITSADTLLRSLLNLSKLDAGGVTPEVRPLAVGPWLTEIAEEFAPAAAGAGLSLRAVPTGLWTRTDPGLLRSAVQNLISNALRYTDDGGVLIGARRRGAEIGLTVADTGRGIGEADLSHVFEAFARLPRDRDVDGAGLGLATVRKVCDLLGHEVAVRSSVGRGTAFEITMPRVAAAHSPAPIARTRAAPSGALTGRRVLCVDNDRAVLDAIRQRFEHWGAKAEAHRGLAEVREAYANGHPPPDLLILDYQLDGDDTGLHVLDFFRTEKDAGPPAILVTASRSPATESLIRSAGVPVLPKPVEPAALRALSVSLLSAR